jgi:tetratricopeptide (TPR) repeat protein
MTDSKKPPIPSSPNVRVVSAEELERALLDELETSGGTSRNALWHLARLYSETRRHEQAFDCVRQLGALAGGPDDEAACFLAQGQLCEQLRDYEAAVDYYRAGLAMNRERAASWYWFNNNLGYSLLQLGQSLEATIHLRVAIRVDPARSNAYKNMGLAMLQTNDPTGAARWFIAATRVNPKDGRSLAHLEELVAAHPELLAQAPDVGAELDACRAQQPKKN